MTTRKFFDGVSVFKQRKIPILPNGEPMVPFIFYEAISLHHIDVDYGEINDGTEIYVQAMPSGDLYIHQYRNEITAILTGAELGIDFRWCDEISKYLVQEYS